MKRSTALMAVIGFAAILLASGCDKRPPPPTPQTGAAKQTLDKVTKDLNQSTDTRMEATQQAIDQSEAGGKAADGDGQ